MCFYHLILLLLLMAMNTRRNEAELLQEKIAHARAPLRDDQVSPRYEDINDDQTPVNPPLMDGAIRAALFQMVQGITTQEQGATTQA